MRNEHFYFPITSNDYWIMDSTAELEKLKLEIGIKAKNGIDFILAASIIWIGIFAIWKYLPDASYNKSVYTFIWGSMLLPLALALSKILKTNWKIKGNPLQPLGLWLNFAQLIYFPFLVFILVKQPDYFIMAYAIITGAHLFPYAWYYNETGYAATSIFISVGSLIIALSVQPANICYVPIFTAISLLLLGIRLMLKNKRTGSRA
ncbi:MAG: hypothetical protein QM786_18880 [Breznakibacter sp.]